MVDKSYSSALAHTLQLTDFMADLITLLFFASIAVAVVFFIGYNKLQSISQLVKEAASNIQVMLRKKLELTQQTMDVCKGYADHEKLVLLKVSADMAGSFKDLANANARAEQALAYVSQLASRFPELKADAHYLNLTAQLESLGNQLQYKREQYNAHVRNYNTARTTIPTVFVARALKFPEAPYLNFEEGGSLDVLQTFQTDDGARLENFLGNLGHKLADGTKAAVDRATEVGTVVAQRAKTSGSAAVDFGKDRLGLKKYHYSVGGAVKGPVSRRELEALVQDKKLSPELFVLEEGTKDWIKFAALVAKDPPPPPDAAIPPPPDARK
jgi:LemA protein